MLEWHVYSVSLLALDPPIEILVCYYLYHQLEALFANLARERECVVASVIELSASNLTPGEINPLNAWDSCCIQRVANSRQYGKQSSRGFLQLIMEQEYVDRNHGVVEAWSTAAGRGIGCFENVNSTIDFFARVAREFEQRAMSQMGLSEEDRVNKRYSVLQNSCYLIYSTRK